MPEVSQTTTQNINLPPPSGDAIQAEKYLNQLIEFIEQDKLLVFRTDLSKFDPSTLQDHFYLILTEYEIEVSHNKHPTSGKDSYIMLFTNIKNVADGSCEKNILAYMHLNSAQFAEFKEVCNQQIERIRKAEEERRLKEALDPLDKALEQLSNKQPENPNSSQSESQSLQTSALSKEEFIVPFPQHPH